MNWDHWSRNSRWPGKALLIYVVGHDHCVGRGYGGSGRPSRSINRRSLRFAESRSPGALSGTVGGQYPDI